MSAVSGRVGLFTVNAFNPNITDDTHATTRGQKSGAMRLEFGKFVIPTAATTAASVRCTVNTGVMAVAIPSKTPSPTAIVTPLQSQGVSGQIYTSALYLTSGYFGIATSGSFLSGFLHIDVTHTGSYSGQASGMEINYMVVGY